MGAGRPPPPSNAERGMSITEDVVRLILEGEKSCATTGRVAKDIVKMVIAHVKVRALVELDTVQMRASSLDVGGDIRTLDAYRAAIAKAKERLETWTTAQYRDIEEGS